MTKDEAAAFLSRYIDNDCYTDICREAHRMGAEALSTGHWENIHETIISDCQPPVIITTETCSRCHRTSSFSGPKKTLCDSHCPGCGAFMI